MDFWDSPDGRFLWYLITEEEDCIEKVTCPEIGQDPCFKKVDCEQVLTLSMVITNYFYWARIHPFMRRGSPSQFPKSPTHVLSKVVSWIDSPEKAQIDFNERSQFL